MKARPALVVAATAAALLLPLSPALADTYGAPELTASASSLCTRGNSPLEVTLTDGDGQSYGLLSASSSGRTAGVKIDGRPANPVIKPLVSGSASWLVTSSRPGTLVITGQSSFDGSFWGDQATLTIPVVNGRC